MPAYTMFYIKNNLLGPLLDGNKTHNGLIEWGFYGNRNSRSSAYGLVVSIARLLIS